MHDLWRTLIAALLAASISAALAEEPVPDHPALRDRFYVTLGAFYPRTTTSAQLDSSRLGVGANIDFENALGMQASKTVPLASGRMRFGERWRVEAEWFELNRSGDKQIDRTIQWGEVVFPVNARVQSAFDFSDLRISGGYSFFRTKDKELGVSLGLHVAAYDVRLANNAIGSEAQNLTAPLPVASVYGLFALTERWAVSGRMDRFSLSYDKIDGSLTALGLDLMYQPFRNVGFGLGSRSLYISMDAHQNDRTLKFRQTFQGPVLYMNASF